MGGRGGGSGSRGGGSKVSSIKVSSPLTISHNMKMFTVRASFEDGSKVAETYTTNRLGTGLYKGAREIFSQDKFSLNGSAAENKAKVEKFARDTYKKSRPPRVAYGSKKRS